MFDRIERVLTRASAALAILGGAGLILATLVTCLSILSKLAGRAVVALTDGVPDGLSWLGPILGEEEIVSFAVGFAVFAALPWVMITRGHIRVDLFRPVFGDRLNRLLDLVADAAMALVAWLILTRQWAQIIRPARRSEEPFLSELLAGNWGAWSDRLRAAQESQILGVKLWPTYVVAEVCVLAFFIVALFCVWRSARSLVRPVAGA